MANTIRIKRSTGSGAPTTLQNAELAFTEGTKTLYVGVGTGGGGGSATTVEAIGGLGAFVSLGSTAQTIEGVKTFTGAIVLGTPGSGTLTNCTGLPVSTGVSGLGTGVATFLGTPSSANLASAVTGGTGTGALVFATSPTLVTPALGTPSALVGTHISGTGANFTAGAVTNAGLTGEVTTSGLAATISNSAVIGKVLTGFTSGAGTVAATDTILQAIQKINGNTSAGIAAAGSLTGATLASNVLASSLTSVGTLSGLTVTAAIVGSVTGNAATATTATNVTTNANLTGAITSSGNTTSLGTASFSSANLAGALTDETGSGSAVFATSPTLVAPTLGAATATSINNLAITSVVSTATLAIRSGKTLEVDNTLTFSGTDSSSVAFGAGGTVVYASGLGAGVATFLATPSSANLISAITDETGTGSLVFSATPTFTGTLNCAALTSTGNVTVGGDLLVNGTTTTVNSTVTTLDDPIITLGGDGNGINDDKDRGVEFKWNDGTAKVGFFGFDESTGYFTFIPQATNTSEVFSGTKGDIQATNFRGALIGNADTVTTNANLTGAITSSGNTTSLGTASFSSANLAGALTDKTGTGVAVFATSPTLVTPTIGAATATSVNKVTITAPATGSTLTVADGKTLTASNTLTFTGTDASSVAFGAGGTVVYTSGLGTGVATFLATPSSANLISAITDETGTGALVFATSPTLVTPTLGEATASSLTVTGDVAVNGGDITTTALTAKVFDTTATAIYLGTIAATDVRIGKSDNTGTTRLYGSVGINGGTLTTSNVSSSIFNTTATTLNLGGAATTLSIGAVTGTATINNANTVVTGDLAVNGGDITTTAATATLMNATATDLSIGGAATTLTMGSTGGGTTALRNLYTKLGNTSAAITTNSGTTNYLTLAPYGNINLSPAIVSVGNGGSQTQLIVTNATDAAGTVSVNGGDLVLTTKTTDGDTHTSVNIIFEGATTNVYDTTLTVTDPTANRTITLPDATDTLVGKATTDTLTNKTWNSVVIAGEFGGTGVANTGKTITLGGNLTTSGAFTTTLTATANTSVTLPTSGTLLNDAATIDGGSY